MANERLSDAVTSFLRGQFQASVADAHQAIADGRIDDSVVAVKRASAIVDAEAEVRKLYSVIDVIHQDLGLPIPPVEMLTAIAPVTNIPQVKEEVAQVVKEPLVVIEPLAPVDVQPAPVAEPVVAPVDRLEPPLPEVPQPKPKTEKEGEKELPVPEITDDLYRETRVIVATYGLDSTKTRFMNMTYANSVSAAFADALPPRSAEEKIRYDAFSQAMAEHREILSSLLDDASAVEINPGSVSEDVRNRIKRLRQFLKDEGYPDNVTAFEMKQLANRREGFEHYETWYTHKRERRSVESIDSGQVFPAFSEPRGRVRQSFANAGSDTEELGKSRKKRKVSQQDSGDFSMETAAEDKAKAEMTPRDKILGTAIFELNEDQTPVLASLDAVAEVVYASALAKLEGEARKVMIQKLIKILITPYILDRSQAFASAMTSYRKDNLKIRDRALAREVRYFLSLYLYPNNLSPQEIGLLMSKQTTVPIILEKRNGWRVDHSKPPEQSIASLPSGKVEIIRQKDHGESKGTQEGLIPVHEFARRKDRITDAQRNYLGVVYKTNGSGGMVYTTRVAAVGALYPVEFAAAIKSGVPKDLGLILAHFGRTGKTLKGMLENALSDGHAPAELRAFINTARNSDAFRDMPDDLFIKFSQR